MPADLHEIIEDAVTDVEIPAEEPAEETPVEPAPTEALEAATEPVEAKTETPEGETPAEAPETPTEPVKASPKTDDFEKRIGIPATSATGRENRIPYSRVRKIVEKAIADEQKRVESSFNPKVKDYEDKVKDYEGKLEQVAKFEQIMLNDSNKFLKMLSSIPAYVPFFKAVEEAFEKANQLGQAPTPAKPTETVPTIDDMPAPDQALSDGTKVYSMDGLKALLAWQAKQVEGRVTKQMEERYKPIESAWQANERIQATLPKVRAQVEEARTWPKFVENEDEIVKTLQADPSISLEKAYQKVVYPKLLADRNKIREEVLKEMKTAPKATSVATTASKVSPQTHTGPRNLEDVISEAVKGLK